MIKIVGAPEKIAVRREMKMLAEGLLSEKNIARLVKNNSGMKRERFIKQLGWGGTHNADLVMHPVHGISVRKSTRSPMIPKDLVDGYIGEARIFKEIKRIQEKKKRNMGVAKVLEVEPGSMISFHEYISGQTHQNIGLGKKTRTAEFLEKMKQKADGDYRRLRPIRGKGNSHESAKASRLGSRIHDATLKMYRLYGDRKVPMSKDQKYLFKRLKRRFPRLYDHNTMRNTMSNGTIIDVSSGKGFTMHRHGGGDRYLQFKTMRDGKGEIGRESLDADYVKKNIRNGLIATGIISGTGLHRYNKFKERKMAVNE